jgi:TonB family protein
MFLDFQDNRPETPRVPQAFTRLERLLLAVVAYQFLLLAYFVLPDSLFAKPVRDLITSEEPLRYVDIQPVVDRAALAKLTAPQSALNRTTPVRPPEPPQASASRTAPELMRGSVEPPKGAEAPQPVTGPSPNEASPAPRRVPGGILGNALRNLDRYVQDTTVDNPEGGAWDKGPAIQFDSKGVDFGPWLRRFRAQVYRNWLIPQAAQVMHGHVVIQMTILRNGTIANPHVVQSSGIEAFDSAALTSLKLSNPTMRLPDVYPGDAIDPFTVIFYYNERIR